MITDFIPKVTLGLIVANVIAFLVLQARPEMVGRWLLIPYQMRKDRSWDRFVLSGFAHMTFLHLFFNMYTLYSFGAYLEQIMGAPFYFIVYFMSIMGGGWLCYILKNTDSSYAALGASGGVVGAVYAMAYIVPEIGLRLLFIPINIPGWIFCLLFAVGSAIMGLLPKAKRGGISHEGHLGGAAVGLLAAVVIMPSKIQVYTNQLLFLGTWASLILLVVADLRAKRRGR